MFSDVLSSLLILIVAMFLFALIIGFVILISMVYIKPLWAKITKVLLIFINPSQKFSFLKLLKIFIISTAFISLLIYLVIKYLNLTYIYMVLLIVTSYLFANQLTNEIRFEQGNRLLEPTSDMPSNRSQLIAYASLALGVIGIIIAIILYMATLDQNGWSKVLGLYQNISKYLLPGII